MTASPPVVVSVPALSPAYYGATSPMTTMPTSPASFSIENILAPRPYAIPHPATARHGHSPYLPLAPHPHFAMLPPEYHHLGKFFVCLYVCLFFKQLLVSFPPPGFLLVSCLSHKHYNFSFLSRFTFIVIANPGFAIIFLSFKYCNLVT